MLRAQPPAWGRKESEGVLVGGSPGAREGAQPLTAGELILRCHRPLHHLRFDEAGAKPVRVRGVMLAGGGERWG